MSSARRSPTRLTWALVLFENSDAAIEGGLAGGGSLAWRLRGGLDARAGTSTRDERQRGDETAESSNKGSPIDAHKSETYLKPHWSMRVLKLAILDRRGCL